MVYVITAAAGRTGRVAAELLLKDGHSVRAIVRSADKGEHLKALGAEIFVGDFTDVPSLVTAFTGATAVYVLNPPNFLKGDPFVAAEKVGNALLSAIQTSKVKRVIALSAIGSNLTSGTGNIGTTHTLENCLSKADAKITFLRAGFYMENFKPLFGVAKEKGILPSVYTPLENKIPMVATADVGAAVAKYLVSDTNESVINIAGPGTFDVNDVAEAFTATLGKSIRPVPIPDEQLLPHFSKLFQEPTASAMVEMTRGFNNGTFVWEQGTKTDKGQTTLKAAVATWV